MLRSRLERLGIAQLKSQSVGHRLMAGLRAGERTVVQIPSPLSGVEHVAWIGWKPIDVHHGTRYASVKRYPIYIFCTLDITVKLTTQTDYALRTLMYLATRSSRVKIADVAALFNISINHVAKVVNLLARFGYIRSVRGIGGGIELAKDPEEVRIGEVIQKMEADMHLLACVGNGDTSCLISSFCKLRRVFAEAERVQFEYLDGVTLADVVPTRRQLDRVQT